MTKPEHVKRQEQWLKQQYGTMFDAIAALLFREDPVGISGEDNTDEYELEARTILPRLRTCQSAEDTLRVVHEEFVRWFDAGTAGPPEHYTRIASEIWLLWERYTREHQQKTRSHSES